MKRLPLRGRLALLTAVAVAIAVAACAMASWFLVQRQLYVQLDKQVNGRLMPLSKGEQPPPDEQLPGGQGGKSNNYNRFLQNILQASTTCSQALSGDTQFRLGPDNNYMQILRADGQYCTIPGQGKITVTGADRAVAEGTSTKAALHDGDGVSASGTKTELRVLTRQVQLASDQTVTLMVALPLGPVSDPLSNLRLILLSVSALGVLGAALAGLLTARAALKPVDTLTDAVENIARTEDLTIKIPEEGTDEIARLGRSFNMMTASLAASQERQQNLIADAGHELRTPLTSMRTNIDLLIKSQQTGRDLPEDTKAKMLVSLKAQMHEMTSLIGDLLQLGSPAARNRQAVEVALHEVASRAVSRARLRGPNLMVEARLDPWYVQGNPDALERAVVNLCDNAVKFSPAGGTVQVRLSRGELTVRDHGPGIPAAEIPYVFERFWRSPGARSLPGSGLGLSIVAQAVEEAHGKVSLETAPGGGALARLWLPGTPNPSSTRFS